jgi:hypothetical protein
MRGKAGSFEILPFHQTIIEIWNQGGTYADMVLATGMSKGTVAGVITRLKAKNYIKQKDLRNFRRALNGEEPLLRAPQVRLQKPIVEKAKAPVESLVRLPKPVPANSAKCAIPTIHSTFRPVVLAKRSATPCCWPFGDPKDHNNFRFCHNPDVPAGKVYCAEHEAMSRGKS